MIEIEPATIAQVQAATNGRMVIVDDDVQGVARALRDIDAGLRLSYNEHEDIWIVYHVTTGPDGTTGEQLVTTAQDLDHRIVTRVREVAASGYDYPAELERVDREAQEARDRAFEERVAPMAERLAHALRKDLGP